MLTQEQIDKIIDEENETKYKRIDPGLCGSCLQCQSDFGMTEDELTYGVGNGSIPDEGGISSAGCDLCGCSYQQTLYPAHAWSDEENPEILHYEICEDCLMYLAGN